MPTDREDISRDETVGGIPTAPRGEASSTIAGRYRTIRLIARGGMASVHLAEQLALHRYIALKILQPPPGTQPEDHLNFERRFKLEAETLATLVHPNIVTVYDYGQASDKRFFLAMEYIEGPRFTDLLVHGALPLDRAITLLLQVCNALRYAHKRGVVHRDLKPSNLLIGQDVEGNEQVKVVDFGLVKVGEYDQTLTREGVVMGSPHCMAPEQVQGGPVDHRADIYAVGVLLYRSITGTYPFHGSNATATMMQHLSATVPSFAEAAPDLRVPPKVEAIVRRCLARNPADRYPDVVSLAADLGSCVGLQPEPDTTSLVLDEDSGPSMPVAPRAPRAPWWAWLGGGLALAFGVVVMVVAAVQIFGGDDAPSTVTEGAPPSTPPSIDAAAPTDAPPPAAAATGAEDGPGEAATGDATPPEATATEAKPTGATPDRSAPPPAAPNQTAATRSKEGPRPPPARKGTTTAPSTAPPAAPEAPPGYMDVPDDLK